jgi:hypothetical protein
MAHTANQETQLRQSWEEQAMKMTRKSQASGGKIPNWQPVQNREERGKPAMAF